MEANRPEEEEYEDEDCNYSDDEFEELEAEVEYPTPSPSAGPAFKHRSGTTPRTKSMIKRHPQIRNQCPQEDEFEEKDTVLQFSPPPKNKLRRGAKSWIPTPKVTGIQRPSVSSVSLQMEFRPKKSGSTMSLARKRIGSQPSKKASSIQQRLDSAKEIQIKDLTSKVRLLENMIHDLTGENRTLKNGFQRQAVALRKYEGAEADLPRVLQFNQNELKYLQQALRKAQSACRKYESGIRTLNTKIISLEDHNARLQKLVETDDLDERQSLQRQLAEMSQELDIANEKLADHARQFDLLQRSHSRHLQGVQAKFRESNRRVYDAEQELYRLTELIRQKDRVISYLRMRSREPGLEPPLHRKVMEEYNSSYKYFYQVEQSFESVNSEYYFPQSNSNTTQSGTPGSLINAEDPRYANYSPQNHSRSRGPRVREVSTATHENEEQQYDRSTGKSNQTEFSEELARRSRERNLDVRCSESEFEEEQIQDEEENGERYEGEEEEPDFEQEEEGIENEEADAEVDKPNPLASTTGIMGSRKESAKTYVVTRPDFPDSNEFVTQYEQFQISTAYEEDFDQSENQTPLSLSYFGASSRSPSVRTPMSRSRFDVWRIKKSRSNEQQSPLRPVLESGDARRHWYADEVETSGMSRGDTGMGNNGGGDAPFTSTGNTPVYQSEEYMSTSVIPEEKESTQSSEEVSEEEPIKYSEEEFYVESDENRDERNTALRTRGGSGTLGSQPTSAVDCSSQSHEKSRVFALDGKFYTFTSKPTYLGEISEVMISDDNRSGVVSKHDSILKSFTPPHSSSGKSRTTPFQDQSTTMSSYEAHKTTAASERSTDSRNSMTTLHNKRPKGPGRGEEKVSTFQHQKTPPFTTTELEAETEEEEEQLWRSGDQVHETSSPQDHKQQHIPRSSQPIRRTPATVRKREGVGNVYTERVQKPSKNKPFK